MARKRLGRAIERLVKTQKDGAKKIESYTLYRDLVVNALDDGVITKNERSVLDRVGKNLGLSGEEQDVIIKDAEKDYTNKKKRAEKRKKQKDKVEPPDLKKKVAELTKLNKTLDKENKKLTDSIKKIEAKYKKLETENRQLKEAAQEPIQELKTLESLGKATEVASDKKVYKTKPKGIEKAVICPHCNKENTVVISSDQPTILTCLHCNERSYTE